MDIWRHRCGYLWATDEEYKRIEQIVKSSWIYKVNKAVKTQADLEEIWGHSPI